MWMKYADMNVTKVKQRQRFHMDKILSGNFINLYKLRMAVWLQSLEQRCVKRPSQLYGTRLENKGFNPEYLVQQEYGVIANDMGEIPLNGKGMPLTHYGEGEEMVYSCMKIQVVLLIWF